MTSSKPIASLSSGLLARPGQARPAMRPQAFSYVATEDLGWNDLGQPDPPAPVVAAEPAPIAAEVPPQAEATVIPPVLAERAKLAHAVAPTPRATRAPRAAPKAAATPAGRKAAFTLRLDSDRHLRLRLASAVAGRSSQQLVVEALDAFLNAQPKVEALARQVPAGATQSFSGEK